VGASSLCRMALQSLRSEAATRDPLSLSVEDRRLQASNKSSDLTERLPRDANFPYHMVDTQGDLTHPGRRTSILCGGTSMDHRVGARPGCSTASSRISPFWRWDDQRGTKTPFRHAKGAPFVAVCVKRSSFLGFGSGFFAPGRLVGGPWDPRGEPHLPRAGSILIER
jgi:hypothetical protein